ncbi:conserved hypothetical protein [Coccidioides posadasii str. Silveira]|uniref:Uncharacterized protein n=1 Tax=Coccidioides posadasii (strain RMSCC 757 / Silveira) TaxID=443226 RepID=E9CZV2_COCPS|nr:conserved hypothetical protein [Coccidioides posadasii str. Silveira]
MSSNVQSSLMSCTTGAWMRLIVAHHLGASPNACYVAGPEDWIYGSFNVCIPVTVSSSWRRKRQRLMLWFPLPYCVSDHFCPGNSDEKLRCEAGTYVWLQQNATDMVVQLTQYSTSRRQLQS